MTGPVGSLVDTKNATYLTVGGAGKDSPVMATPQAVARDRVVVGKLLITNYSAAAKYVKVYDKATAPNPDTDIPLCTIPVATISFLPVPFGPEGLTFINGFALAIVNALPETDVSAVAAGDVRVTASYL